MIPKRKYGKAVLDWRKEAKTCRYRSKEVSRNPWCTFCCGLQRCTYERCLEIIKAGVAVPGDEKV